MKKNRKKIVLIICIVAVLLIFLRLYTYQTCTNRWSEEELQLIAIITKNISHCSSLEEGSIENSTCTDPSISEIKCVDQVYFFTAILEDNYTICHNISFPCMEDTCINLIQKTCDNITVDLEDIFYCKAWVTHDLNYCNNLNYSRARGDYGCRGGYYIIQAYTNDDPSFCNNIKDRSVKMFCETLAHKNTKPILNHMRRRCLLNFI